MNNIRDTDRGYTKTLAVFRKLGFHLRLGVQGPLAEAEHKDEDGAGQGITVGELAAIHEFGLGVPERSWLRAWFEENHRLVVEDIRSGLMRVVAGHTTLEELTEALGLKYVGLIQARIVAGIEPALDPRTIERKGSSTPLIDTGQLKSAISHMVLRPMIQQALAF